MQLAAKGKSASQGGYNIPPIKELVKLNKGKFDKDKGPINEEFPDPDSLSRSDLNRLLGLLMKLKQPDIGQAARDGAIDRVKELLKVPIDPKQLEARSQSTL